mmetsp:Transcript_7480/g.14177  ORF Transcript_7480/g.14177 Transcript_7480/m.14177 type:complete len:442 (-) Transcript_7480:2860-4185(-)
MDGNTHHCYLLQSLSSPSKTYIGYTVNPHRRIKQHNGIIKGGAKYTSKFRPWKFICITAGFESEQQGLKFEWAWQNPKRSRIFRSGLGGGGSGTGSSRALAGSLQKMSAGGGPLGKLRLLMILLCESHDFQKKDLNVYFFEEGHKLDFEDFVRIHYSGAHGNDADDEGYDEDKYDEDIMSADEKVERTTLERQMKIHLVDGVEEMPFFRLCCNQKQRDLIIHDDGDGGSFNDDNNVLDHDNDDIGICDSNDSILMTEDCDNSVHDTTKHALHYFMDDTGGAHDVNDHSSVRDDPFVKSSESGLEHSISSLSINKNECECTIKSPLQNEATRRWKYSQDETVYNKAGCTSSSGFIDLLDSSDDDDDDDEGNLKGRYNNCMSRDFSKESSDKETMDVCSPITPRNSSTTVIDLTASSPARRNLNFGDNIGGESSHIIDLCSPI